jgi:hypothetical protein
VQLDNVALVPGNLLPFKSEYQQIANGLPQGGILIVLPHELKQRRAFEKTAVQLKQKAKTGDRIEQGDELGESGKTGWTWCVPHLHIQVEVTGNSWYTRSVPIHFSDRDVLTKNPDGIPTKGNPYVSDNTPPKTSSGPNPAIPSSEAKATCLNLQFSYDPSLAKSVSAKTLPQGTLGPPWTS